MFLVQVPALQAVWYCAVLTISNINKRIRNALNYLHLKIPMDVFFLRIPVDIFF